MEKNNISYSYWQTVWHQFKKNQGALIGLCFVIVLFAIAFFAPFIAEKRPFIWMTDSGTTFPFFKEFFAPTEAPECLLETSYNYILCCLVGFAILSFLLKRMKKVYLIFAVTILCAIPFVTTKRKFDTNSYKQMMTEGKGWGLFPIIRYGPFEQGFGIRIPPSWYHRQNKSNHNYHWMGTDKVGRDVLTRMIHGTRVSLAVGVLSVLISTIIGIIIGAIAGFYGGMADIVISRMIEIIICFPQFFAIITVVAIMDERSILNIILVISLFGWTGIARLVRGEVLRERSLDYVTASIALGAKTTRTIFRHILPNSLSPVFVTMTFGIAGSILMESGLSFLGFGVDIPTTSWGELLNQAREAPQEFWWLAIFPGIPIFFTVTIYNLVGEGLRDAMDPKLREKA